MNNAVEQIIAISKAHLQAVLGAKNVQELTALQSGLTKPVTEKSAAYLQHVQAIATGASSNFTKAWEANLAAFKNAMTLGQNAVESAQTSAKKAVEGA